MKRVMVALMACGALALGACSSGGVDAAATPTPTQAPPSPTPAAVAATSEALSFSCGLATSPGVLLAGWVLTVAGEPVDDFAFDVAETASEVRQECPLSVIQLIDAVQSQAEFHARGQATQDDVTAAVKAYWVALSDEYDTEAAYVEAVEVFGGAVNSATGSITIPGA